MKRMTLFAVVAALWGGGCSPNNTPEADDRLVELVPAPEMRNAIITQHSLYPYHFVNNAETLNELGRLDLDVLARHFRDHPGELNIRAGDAAPALYKARVAFILKELEKAGVAVARVRVVDALPGGEGMYSEEVVQILQPLPGGPVAMETRVAPLSGGGYAGSAVVAAPVLPTGSTPKSPQNEK